MPKPNPQSPRLDDPALDVMRRAFAQYLHGGGDPRVLPSVEASAIVEHDGLFYVAVRDRPGAEPLVIFRLFDDVNRSLKGLVRVPPAAREAIADAAKPAPARRKARAA